MSINETLLYTARTHATGGREGHARSDDGHLDVRLARPGSHDAGTNPEQLLAAGWSACFIGSMRVVARERRIQIPADVAVNAEIDLGTNDGGFFLSARLSVSLPGLPRDVAQSLVEAGHATCPYSKATRGNIDVEVLLV